MAEQRRKYGRKYCRYTEMKVDYVDYKSLDLLKMSLSERGKIMPRRLTGNSKNMQEQVEMSIKRARHMALIPYKVDSQAIVAPAYV
ncbi:MAG: 30S ribosomal protein S18 [Campylobacterota bacterium]|nr:30S ribosomal protein S18 [Campylobacterota bacterium]